MVGLPACAAQRRDDASALKAKNAQQAQEIEDLKAQLAATKAKEWQTSETIFGNLLFPF